MTTYFVDATTGNDADDGLSEADAWQTVNKVNGEAFNAGDFVGFKRDETFRDGNILILDQGGDASDDVTYGAYGSGVMDPIISAARLVAGWVNTVGEEYSASLLASQGGIDPRSIWQGDTQLVLGVQGALARGEYFYDAAADELHVRTSTGADPSSFTIEAANIRNCIFIQDSYITVQDIVCEKGNTYNVQVIDADPVYTNITLDRVISNRGAWHGLQIGGGGDITPNNVTLNECTIYMWNRGGTTSEDAIFQAEGNAAGGNNLAIKNCIIEGDIPWGVNTNNGRNGISIIGGDNLLIEYTDITGCDHGIKLEDSVTGWTIRYNYIHEIGDDGFELTNLDSATGIIHHNVLFRVSDQFFDINFAVAGDAGAIYNNACYESLNQAWSLKGPDGTNATIKNNIFVVSDDRLFTIQDTDSTIEIADFDIDYNTYYDFATIPGSVSFATFQSSGIESFATWQARGLDINSQVVNPLYVSAGGTDAEDYRVESGSPAIDAGVDVGLELDYAGVSIPQGSAPDIGAFEFETPSTFLSHGPNAETLAFLDNLPDIDEFWRGYFSDVNATSDALSKISPVED